MQDELAYACTDSCIFLMQCSRIPLTCTCAAICTQVDVTLHTTCAVHQQQCTPAGLVFVGGFSYADVLGSAKGWAGTIRHNPQLWQAFDTFYHRYM